MPATALDQRHTCALRLRQQGGGDGGVRGQFSKQVLRGLIKAGDPAVDNDQGRFGDGPEDGIIKMRQEEILPFSVGWRVAGMCPHQSMQSVCGNFGGLSIPKTGVPHKKKVENSRFLCETGKDGGMLKK